MSVSWTVVAWDRITFSFRNAHGWYCEKTNFKHVVTTWVRGIPEIHLFQHRKNRYERRKATDSIAGFRRAIAPADAITLRCNHSTTHLNEKRAAARHWNSRQRENLSILAAETVHQRQHFRKFRVTSRPWRCKITCLRIFLGCRGPTRSINTYQSSNWRTDLRPAVNRQPGYRRVDS